MLISLCACILTSCSPQEGDKAYDDDLIEEVSFHEYSNLELEILDLVNSYRTLRGFNELEKLDEISIQAGLHNIHMTTAREVCHHNFGKRYRILSKEIGAKSMGENVGYGYASAGALLNAWVKSESHRKILEGRSSYFGVSTREGKERKVYVTLIFVRK